MSAPADTLFAKSFRDRREVDATRAWALFTGEWAVHRTLGPYGVFRGRASFVSLTAEARRYTERGEVTMPQGGVLRAEQTFHYRVESDGIRVYRHSPLGGELELLHALRFDATEPGVATGIHHCGDDVYRARYQFASDVLFYLTYVVTGPRKNVTIHSRYRKSASEA